MGFYVDKTHYDILRHTSRVSRYTHTKCQSLASPSLVKTANPFTWKNFQRIRLEMMIMMKCHGWVSPRRHRHPPTCGWIRTKCQFHHYIVITIIMILLLTAAAIAIVAVDSIVRYDNNLSFTMPWILWNNGSNDTTTTLHNHHHHPNKMHTMPCSPDYYVQLKIWKYMVRTLFTFHSVSIRYIAQFAFPFDAHPFQPTTHYI